MANGKVPVSRININDFIKEGGIAVLSLTCMKFTGRGDSWNVEVCTPAGAATTPPSLVKDVRPVFEQMIREGFQIDCVTKSGVRGILVLDQG